LTTDDLILFLSQYSTVAAAKNYLSTFKTFYDYLKSEHNASLQIIDWNNPGLKFSKDFREVELITETQFQHLLTHSSASTLLPPEQMQLVLLLMRRAGLRCSEVSFLRVLDFISFGQLKLSINFSKSVAGKRDLPLYLLFSENELNLFLNYYKPKYLQCLDDPRYLLSPFIHNKTFLTPQQIGTQVAKVIEAAGLLSQTAHKLRHGFASSLLAAWWIRHLQQRQKNIRTNSWAQNALLEFCRPNIEGRAITYLDDIRSLMGHSSLDVTFDRYIHNLDLITADAVNLNYFLGAPEKINVSVAANIAGVSDRELRRVFSPNMRKRSQIDKRFLEIETVFFKDWLTGRL
jgi:site-specific recombinase XerD